MIHVGGIEHHGQQVGAGEVAIVVGLLLGAHAAGLVTLGIIEARLLDHLVAILDQLDLALHLELDGALHEAEGVDVLDLGASAELGLAHGAHRDVDVAAHRALGHVAVADAEIGDDGVDRLEVGGRLLGTAHVRLGDDLQQRRAGTVEVDAGHAVKVLVQGLAGVLLQVGVVHPDALGLALFQGDLHFAGTDDGVVHLAGLVALGQVGVEVVLAVEHRDLGDLGVDRQPELHRHGHRLLVEHRQYPGQAQIHGAGLGVGLGAEGGGGPGEDL